VDLLSNEIISVLTYLLPGFVAAWVLYGLTAFPKPSQFERIIQALIFTIIIQGIVNLIKIISLQIGSNLFCIGRWTSDINLVLSVFVAIIMGLVFTYYANNDKFHSLLRKFKITQLTSFPSEWYGSFCKNKTFIVLHLNDGRRLYGWPVEWPNQPNNGHFSIAMAEWLTDNPNETIKLDMVKNILIDASDVKFVEFMKYQEDETYE